MRICLQPLYLVQAAHRVGAAAEAGEQDKDDHHGSHVTAAGSVFHPLVCESLGLLPLHSRHVINAIARRLSFEGNMTVSKAVTNLHKQLSVKYGPTMPRCCYIYSPRHNHKDTAVKTYGYF